MLTTSLTHLKNAFSESLQSKPPAAATSANLHLTKSSAPMVTSSSFETKTSSMIWRKRWIEQQFVVQFDRFGSGDDACVRWYIAGDGRATFPHHMATFFLKIGIESVQ